MTDPVPTTKGFADALARAAARHKNIVVLTSDMEDIFKLGRFRTEFGDRFFNVGNAEAHLVDVASGMARRGKTA